MPATVPRGCRHDLPGRRGSVQRRAHRGGGRDVAGGDDGPGDRGQQLDEAGERGVVERVVGAERDGVGAVLESPAQRPPGVGQRRRPPSAGPAPRARRDHGRPLGVVVVARPLDHRPGHVAGGRLEDVATRGRRSPSGRQQGDVAVAAVLAQQRRGVPEHVERIVGPGEGGVGGEQARPSAAPCGPPRPASSAASSTSDRRRRRRAPGAARRRAPSRGPRGRRRAPAIAHASGSALATRDGAKL